MVNQQDLQAAYEYGVKLAYEHLQKNAYAGSGGAIPPESEMPGRMVEEAVTHPIPGQVGASYQMAPGGEMLNAQQLKVLKQHIAGLPAEARAAIGIPNAPQLSEIASRSYGAANSAADRFLAHMGRHPAAYGLGAAGLGAAGLAGLGLGIGNAVHNSND